MPQRRIDWYFPRQSLPSPPLSGTSFLDLPYPLRRRIYLLTGLVRFCPINFNQEGLNFYKYCGKHSLKNACFYKARKFYGRGFGKDFIYSCSCTPLPIPLLYVSRIISDEVSSILYSQNKFTISQSDSWGLRPLRNLSSKALKLLKSLTIRLNNCSCVFDYEWFTIPAVHPCHPLCQSHGCHDRPLGNVARQDRAVLDEWQNIVNILAANVPFQSLSLSFVCDTRDFQTAQIVVESLGYLPLLRNCSIRLRQNPDWPTYCLAQSTSLQLIGQAPEEKLGQNNQHLPNEILEQILSYTELVAPFQLEWCPDHGLVPFDCCKTCTDTLDCCCCSFYHAAYATSCSCWRLPLSLFLVCRKVHQIAISVFYSYNEFVILPAGIKSRLYYPPSPLIQVPIIQFFERLPFKAFSYLRSITLAFPDFMPRSVLSDQGGMRTWEHAIDVITQRIDLPRFSLTVLVENSKNNTSREPAEEWLHAYKKFVRPLTRLKKLSNLFIHLAWPYGSEEQYENMLEKSVLGEHYDAINHGKYRAKPPFWHDYWSQEGRVLQADGLKLWPPDY